MTRHTSPRRPLRLALVATVLLTPLFGIGPSESEAIQIVLDYTLDDNNWGWFSATPEGLARRASLNAAAGFLSEIITNDDWDPLPSLDESFTITDIFQPSIVGLSGETIQGVGESDGAGYTYTIPTTNRSSVGANEYVVYVAAFAFDTGTSAHAKAGWDSNDRRNAAGLAGTEFNTWGGRVYFDLSDPWYSGQNPGANPTDNYGVQDPDKTPDTDITTDNWDYSTSSDTWKGFDLESIDPAADGKPDLYATGVHELLHVLGATSSNFPIYVGLDGAGNLIGEHVMQAYGGPVPADGGHFATDLQSIVWASGDIVSEVSLDPNSLRSVRKYLTEVDAALLRDLGYDVLTEFPSTFSPGDYNRDGLVDAADYTVWRDAYGTDTLIADGDDDGDIDMDDYTIWSEAYVASAVQSNTVTFVPEPNAWMVMAVSLVLASLTGAGRKPATAW